MKKIQIPAGVKIMIVPVASVIILVILSIIAFKIGYGQITRQRAELNQSRKNEKILAAKIDLLSGIESSVINQTNMVVAALPDTNPAIMTLYQIRNLAASQNVAISNIKIGAGGGAILGGITAVNISFDADGDINLILNLISGVKQFAPITHITKAVLGSSDLATTKATITVKTYWAKFPTKLPSVLDPTTSLTEAEKDTMDKVSALSIPPLVNLVPAEPFERLSPFGD